MNKLLILALLVLSLLLASCQVVDSKDNLHERVRIYEYGLNHTLTECVDHCDITSNFIETYCFDLCTKADIKKGD